MSPPPPLPIAIIGGGLCGLALATALRARSLPFKIYESRPSFTELGAGINLGPNTLEAFRLIDPELSRAVEALCTRNPAGREEVWMLVRMGGKGGGDGGVVGDGDVVAELRAPPTGNATVRRSELLNLLAGRAGEGSARFGVKVVDVLQDEESVVLVFADGGRERVGVVVACDGIHSTIRRRVLGAEGPRFSGAGAYRAVLSMADLEGVVGMEVARTSALWVGPGGYVIMYPIELGERVNIGFWPRKARAWEHGDWVLQSQRAEMESEFEGWGETVHRIMGLMGDPPFSAAFYHAEQPQSVVHGRVCLIGDAAHAMPPHQGAGAGQAMEDSLVLAEVLGEMSSHSGSGNDFKRALKAYESVRTPRSQKVLESSVEAMDFWSDFYREDVTAEEVAQFAQDALQRFQWIWHDDLAAQSQRAKEAYRKSAAS